MESCRTPLLEAWKVAKSGSDSWGPLGELGYWSFPARSGDENGSFHQLLSRKKACQFQRFSMERGSFIRSHVAHPATSRPNPTADFEVFARVAFALRSTKNENVLVFASNLLPLFRMS